MAAKYCDLPFYYLYRGRYVLLRLCNFFKFVTHFDSAILDWGRILL